MIRLCAAALAMATSLAVTGCGATPPVQQVPALEQRLADVDAAVASGDPDALETAVESLVDTVDDAEAAEQLDAGHADRIRDAAETLLAEVPEPEPDQPVEPSPSRSEDPAEDDEGDEDESGDGDRGAGKSRGKAKGKDKD